jgi:undecaprenyl-diphosphatase
VPGVVLLFSLAAIANSTGISAMSLMAAGAIGAIIGDLSSYFIGRHLQSNVSHSKWFTRHKSWLEQGEWFIKKWGWLSVIVGRFLGPLRPVIPIAAGTLGMRPNQFVPLSLLTVIVWAPAYLLPGYFTGELTNLWQIQPLSNREMVKYIATAIVISGSAMAIYHHAHPERWHLKGWITRHQADHWPITSILLSVITFTCAALLVFFTPSEQNQQFYEWTLQWHELGITSYWDSLRHITDRDFVTLLFVLLIVWLGLSGQIALAFLGSVFLAGIGTLSAWLLTLLFKAESSQHVSDFYTFTLFVGFISTLITARIHGLKRWPVYFIASLILITASASHLWIGTLSLSTIGQLMFLGLGFNGLLRATWKITHLPNRISSMNSFTCLLVLVSIAYALIAFHTNI